jgi:hypothetical protein
MARATATEASWRGESFSNPTQNPQQIMIHASNPSSKSVRERWFYSIASLALLALTVIGFRLFYLQGKAFPGRELTPPIRTLLIIHGVLMTAWMIFSVVQPLLVATGRKRMHMMLGKIGVVLAIGIVLVGLRVAIAAARVNPPDLRVFGLTPMEFVMVPLIGIITFGLFVFIGVWNRRRPEVHRPMMLLASLAVVAAPLGRIPMLNDWYANTRLELVFSAFLTMLLVGAVMLAGKSMVSKSFDRWLATGLAALVVVCIGASLTARTQGWNKFASSLCGQPPQPAAKQLAAGQ